ADAFLRRLDSLAPGANTDGVGTSAVRDLLASAAYPTVLRAARSVARTLERLRHRAAEMRAENDGRADVVEFFDILAREGLNDPQRMLTVLEEIDNLAQPERAAPHTLGEHAARADQQREEDELE